ncbi:5-formyltetrahydrofolate cyclo-ligase [Actinocrinis puniceicyclus]|uniref:5-formyltetrahydrofolate cyclo-ligase n=1 Tax=Actinocrinis puniceicyclus TaxID=977794 RepID=UPI001B8C1A6C|nr:5-formyltetrahydrofolate cyclo-ligase [Actinocrinis puniceicyclus]
MSDTKQPKQAVRERVWATLEASGFVEPGVTGYIPAFTGAQQAADRLASLDVWRGARVVKAGPDRAQQPVRVLALEAGKLLYMAAPRLAQRLPFYLLDPGTLTVPAIEAGDRTVAARVATAVDTQDMRPVDLVVCGSVAVNTSGARLGKGAGYSDIEIALLAEAGLISERTTIATSVHDSQVLDEDLPEREHDFRVDLIVTPTQVVWCSGPRRRPARVLWHELTAEQIDAMPALKARWPSRPRRSQR